MNRRPRRSGINFVENDKDRKLTYFKRRAGLYKSVSDLSTLTGAKVVIVTQAESGKTSAFGAPSANPIIESFLSQSPLTNPPIGEGEMARITYLQDELFRLEKDKMVEEKRVRETKARLKEILETSGVAKLSSDNVEDLGHEELTTLFQRLALVKEDINNQVKASNQLEVSGQGDPSLPLSSSSRPSRIKMPPRCLPWSPLQASSQHGQSPWAPLLQSSRSQLSLREPATILPSEHAPPPPPQLLHHQADVMLPQPNAEAHQFGYSLSPAQLPSLPQQVNLEQNYAYANNANFEPVFDISPITPPPANQHANSHNFAADGQPTDGYQWPPFSPFNDPDFGADFHALNVHLGLADDNGGQATDGNDEHP